jgi:invasion protein IalB
MKMKLFKIFCLMMIVSGLYLAVGLLDGAHFPGAAQAAPASKAGRQFLGSFQDWDAFTEKRNKTETACYTIAVPKDKQPAKLKRREVYMMVTHWPKAKIENQVSVIMGYPLKKGSVVTFSLDKRSFKMFIDGDRAWAWDSKQDNEMTDAMKKSATITIKGISARGAETTDRYSLSGFAAAHNAITKACY